MVSKLIQIGTSGWFYEHWNEKFYPLEISHELRLSYYSNFFSTVEINTTFYHYPKPDTVKHWVTKTPKNFLFSVKANRLMTHRKKLIDCEDLMTNFLEVMLLLKGKLGPLLFQLPPSFQKNKERLEEFLQILPKGGIYVFEFRHKSWESDDIYDLLHKYNASLCISDLNGYLTPLEVTSDLVYLRLHGPKRAYKGSYNKKELTLWKERILKWEEKKLCTFCYFDNDEKGYAIQDALTLKNLLS